jgi:hypothetical protein
MFGALFLHVVWVAGTRMINQGSDRLSRGDLTSGVMRGGEDFLDHTPLNESAWERSPKFEQWMRKALPGNGWSWLAIEGWFEEAFQDPMGRYVWAPPPALALVALEQLYEVMYVHPHSSHVFVCPM